MSKRRGSNEGSIYKRKDGRWAATVHLGYKDGDRKRKTFYGNTRREVQAKLTAARAAQQQGRPVAFEQLTVSAFLKRWLEESAKPRVRPATYVDYESIVRLHLVPSLGRLKLQNLEPRHVQQLLNAKLETGLSAARVRGIQRVLTGALNRALKWELVGRNVSALVDGPRVEHKEVTVMSPDDAKTFLAATAGDRLEALYTVALAVGLRKGEALGLRWSDIDFDGATLSVRNALQRIDGELRLVEPKSRSSRRTIALPDFAVASLRTHKARQNEERLRLGKSWQNELELVFTSTVGTPLDERAVTRHFKAMLVAAGLPESRFHDLRHSCASLLLAQGVQPRVVMETLGHSRISMTMDTYSHVLPTLQRTAATEMEQLLAT